MAGRNSLRTWQVDVNRVTCSTADDQRGVRIQAYWNIVSRLVDVRS